MYEQFILDKIGVDFIRWQKADLSEKVRFINALEGHRTLLREPLLPAVRKHLDRYTTDVMHLYYPEFDSLMRRIHDDNSGTVADHLEDAIAINEHGIEELISAYGNSPFWVNSYLEDPSGATHMAGNIKGMWARFPKTEDTKPTCLCWEWLLLQLKELGI